MAPSTVPHDFRSCSHTYINCCLSHAKYVVAEIFLCCYYFCYIILFFFLLIHRQKSFTLTLYCFAVMLQLIYSSTAFAYRSWRRCSISATANDDIVYCICIAIYRNTGILQPEEFDKLTYMPYTHETTATHCTHSMFHIRENIRASNFLNIQAHWATDYKSLMSRPDSI